MEADCVTKQADKEEKEQLITAEQHIPPQMDTDDGKSSHQDAKDPKAAKQPKETKEKIQLKSVSQPGKRMARMSSGAGALTRQPSS